jgi:mycobactin lysine-N-oxygenase
LTRRATVQVEVEYQRIKTVREFDYVVDAARFDRAWFWKLFTPDARLRIKTVLKGILEDVSGKEKLELIDENPNLLAGLLEPNIDANLRLRNLKPDLFLPMLSSLTRGPGFPNLSCLGLLSDRVLKPYAIEPEDLVVHTENS